MELLGHGAASPAAFKNTGLVANSTASVVIQAVEN